MSENYWDNEYTEMAGAEGGSGGIVAECVVSPAFKVYASGVSPVDSLFLCNKDNRDAQKAKAKKLSEDNGKAKIDFGLAIVAKKDGATSKGEAVTWKDDRVFFVADWTSAFKQVVKPALVRLGVKPGKAWMRIGFSDDPHGGKETDANGVERTKQVAHPTQLFKSKAEAHAARGSNGSAASTPAESQKFNDTLVGLFKKKSAEGKSIEQIIELVGDDKDEARFGGREKYAAAIKAAIEQD